MRATGILGTDRVRDETVLASDMESNPVLALSFWKTKEDAERYHKMQYPNIKEILSNLEAAVITRKACN